MTAPHEQPPDNVHPLRRETVGATEKPAPQRRLRLTKASDIRIRPTHWMWESRIPQGALTLGPGREGIGKSLFCAWLAAQVTHGTLPGVHHGEPKSVIYTATEDSWEATIAPRLLAAGADLDRIYRVEVETIAGTLPLTLPRDCDDLADEIADADVALLILDPLISAIDSRVDVNREELRTALEPLAKLADTTNCAIFGLAHFNKASGTDVLSRITGSRAFSAVARAALAFARDSDARDKSCVISQAKNNLGSLDLPSLRYVVDQVEINTDEGPGQWGRLRFTGETTTTVEDLLNNDGAGEDDTDDKNEVDTWLHAHLDQQGGCAPANAIYQHGRKCGYSRDQLKRSKRRLGITGDKDGMAGGWTWRLPSRTPEGSEERTPP